MSQSPSTGSIPSPASQAGLADLLGISPAQASRLLSGERLPSIELMVTIRQKLDWSCDDQATQYVDKTYAAGLKQVWARYLEVHAEASTARP